MFDKGATLWYNPSTFVGYAFHKHGLFYLSEQSVLILIELQPVTNDESASTDAAGQEGVNSHIMEKELVLTKSGMKRIQDELEHLRTVHRKEVADRIRDSKEFGELSENSEYEEAKNEQAFVEGRILELKRILQNAHIIEDEEVPVGIVGVGSKVTVRDLESGDEWEYTIVGSVEADPTEDRISNESPVGEALIDKKVGAIIEVLVPEGTAKYQIVKISK